MVGAGESPRRAKTYLWGKFTAPIKRPVPARLDYQTFRGRHDSIGAAERSMTPAGFARAFAEANP